MRKPDTIVERAGAPVLSVPRGVDEDSAGFFAGLTRDELLVLESTSCGTLLLPWLPRCPICGSSEFRIRRLAGTGTVYSWVRVCRPLNDEPWQGPFTVLTVDLDEGPRIFARLVGSGRVGLGTRVIADYSRGAEGVLQFEVVT